MARTSITSSLAKSARELTFFTFYWTRRYATSCENDWLGLTSTTLAPPSTSAKRRRFGNRWRYYIPGHTSLEVTNGLDGQKLALAIPLVPQLARLGRRSWIGALPASHSPDYGLHGEKSRRSNTGESQDSGAGVRMGDIVPVRFWLSRTK